MSSKFYDSHQRLIISVPGGKKGYYCIVYFCLYFVVRAPLFLCFGKHAILLICNIFSAMVWHMGIIFKNLCPKFYFYLKADLFPAGEVLEYFYPPKRRHVFKYSFPRKVKFKKKYFPISCFGLAIFWYFGNWRWIAVCDVISI